MYRTPSPVYDVTDGTSPSRKVKGLPKRRRVNDLLFDSNDIAATRAFLAAAAEHGQDIQLPGHHPLPLPEYYIPLFQGMQDMLGHGADLTASHKSNYPVTRTNYANAPSLPVDQGMRAEEDDQNEYIDHLQQPGNTKKRKVPVVHPFNSDSQIARDSFEGDWPSAHDRLSGGDARAANQVQGSQDRSFYALKARPTKVSAATRANLRHKEMLKTRKRQLMVVLGAVYNGDSLALEQALSSAQPFARASSFGSAKEDFRTRPSNRSKWKAARRRSKAPSKPLPSWESTILGGFSFRVASATSERLVVTSEEVASLHHKFEVEWAAQDAKNAEAAAKQAARAGGLSKGANRTTQASAVQPPSTAKGRGGSKKKKRSALANASNPHHLRNYVPSRVPNSGQAPPSAAAIAASNQNLIGPLAIRFLSATLPPRRRRASPANTGIVAPGDEWICPFCESDIFYSSEEKLTKAIRSRRKILSRRRRAREKAAATANGAKGSAAQAGSSSSNADDADGYEDEDVTDRSGVYGGDETGTSGTANNSKRDRGRG